MTRLANAEAYGPNEAPPPPAVGWPPEPPWFRVRRLVVRDQPAAPPAGSPYPVPEFRPATFEQPAFTWDRHFGLWDYDAFTGAHGFVRRFQFDAAQLAQARQQQTWDVSRRTLRSSPTEAWDAGTAVGRQPT